MEIRTPQDSILRPETPPPSTHRIEAAVVSPQTPTHPPSKPVLAGGASLFDDDNKTVSQPSTPVLYNLIRNEGPPKFVIASQQLKPKPTPEIKDDRTADDRSPKS